jgi:hypothetical protein
VRLGGFGWRNHKEKKMLVNKTTTIHSLSPFTPVPTLSASSSLAARLIFSISRIHEGRS